MYEILRDFLSDKDTGDFTFEALSFCHILYLLIIVSSIVLVLFLFRNKSSESKKKLVDITVTIALCVYIADIFLMPFSEGEIDIDKLPFHICTLMSVMCYLSRHTKFWSKFKTSFTYMGLIGALLYIAYPSGVSTADGYSYRIVQTVLYHGLMVAQGVFAIAYDDLDTSWKNLKYDAIAIVGLAIWAILGNALYSGTITELCTCKEGCTEVITLYDRDFNWFFVKHDALGIVSDEIDMYIAPFITTGLIFGLCVVMRFIKTKVNKHSKEIKKTPY